MLRRLRSVNLLGVTKFVRFYDDKVLDHFNNPKNVGTMDPKKKTVGTGLVGSPACGDVMRLQIEVDDEGNIVDAVFKTFGCGSAIASSSYATEIIKGKNIFDASNIKNKEIAEELKLPPVKMHCSMLAEDAIKAAVDDFIKKNPDHPCICGRYQNTSSLNIDKKKE